MAYTVQIGRLLDILRSLLAEQSLVASLPKHETMTIIGTGPWTAFFGISNIASSEVEPSVFWLIFKFCKLDFEANQLADCPPDLTPRLPIRRDCDKLDITEL